MNWILQMKTRARVARMRRIVTTSMPSSYTATDQIVWILNMEIGVTPFLSLLITRILGFYVTLILALAETLNLEDPWKKAFIEYNLHSR